MWAEAKGMITKANADIILYIAIAFFVGGLIYMLYPWLQKIRIKERAYGDDKNHQVNGKIDSCSWSDKKRIKAGEIIWTIKVAFTLNVKSPPVNLTKMQLYAREQMLEPTNLSLPITQKGGTKCYIAKYEIDQTDIYWLSAGNKFRLFVLVAGKEWYSEEFSLPYPESATKVS
jgi:hypothetical protein